MKFGEWYFSKPYEDRSIIAEACNKGLSVVFEDKKYTVLACKLDVTELKVRHYYRFHAPLEIKTLEHRFFYTCFDENGVETHKGHLRSEDTILIPENCCRVTLELLLFSHHPGSARLSEITLTETGAYVPRKVRLCAVAWDMIGGEQPKTFLENVDNVMAELDIVCQHKPDVVVFTEAVFQTRKDAARQPLHIYNKLDDPYITALCKKAHQYHTYIVCSILERDADDLKRLTGLLINRDGEIQNIYRKTHLTMGELESGSSLENELPVFQTDFGTVGIQICWDHFFPECSRALMLKGAELLLIPTHGFRKERLVTRAMENGIHVVSAFTFSRGTMIITPNGSVADEAEGKGYAFAEVDLNEPIWCPWLSCSSSAESNPTYLLERRPELYGNLCDPIDY